MKKPHWKTKQRYDYSLFRLKHCTDIVELFEGEHYCDTSDVDEISEALLMQNDKRFLLVEERTNYVKPFNT